MHDDFFCGSAEDSIRKRSLRAQLSGEKSLCECEGPNASRHSGSRYGRISPLFLDKYGIELQMQRKIFHVNSRLKVADKIHRTYRN
eukprot:COSAG02_NODE_4227_length_5610_cov_4.036654_2_plen_86_part_00